MTNLANLIKDLEPEFIELISERYGLVIHVNQTMKLVRAVVEACHKLHCKPQEYLERLKKISSNSLLLADLIAAITVGESYFFRDKHQMSLLEAFILPELIERNKNRHRLKIWSAGCSSGEEIYTIAMLLVQLLPNSGRWDLQLLGTDINANALEKANVGVYNQWSMRSIPEEYSKRYFVKSGRVYNLNPEIRNMVSFKYLNLSDNTYPSILNGTQEMDLILCRNVLIYFDENLVTKIMKKLSLCMTDDAFLLLGASDPIVTTDADLSFHHNGAIYFTKKGLDSDD